ncbi:MAG: hypothetical protein NTV63_02590 [Candidatus Woesearchaeota archaeon]|nr:hypothetical protein [Candidatus Woesearchaeota archaeon]
MNGFTGKTSEKRRVSKLRGILANELPVRSTPSLEESCDNILNKWNIEKNAFVKMSMYPALSDELTGGMAFSYGSLIADEEGVISDITFHTINSKSSPSIHLGCFSDYEKIADGIESGNYKTGDYLAGIWYKIGKKDAFGIEKNQLKQLLRCFESSFIGSNYPDKKKGLILEINEPLILDLNAEDVVFSEYSGHDGSKPGKTAELKIIDRNRAQISYDKIKSDFSESIIPLPESREIQRIDEIIRKEADKFQDKNTSGHSGKKLNKIAEKILQAEQHLEYSKIADNNREKETQAQSSSKKGEVTGLSRKICELSGHPHKKSNKPALKTRHENLVYGKIRDIFNEEMEETPGEGKISEKLRKILGSEKKEREGERKDSEIPSFEEYASRIGRYFESRKNEFESSIGKYIENAMEKYTSSIGEQIKGLAQIVEKNVSALDRMSLLYAGSNASRENPHSGLEGRVSNETTANPLQREEGRDYRSAIRALYRAHSGNESGLISKINSEKALVSAEKIAAGDSHYSLPEIAESFSGDVAEGKRIWTWKERAKAMEELYRKGMHETLSQKERDELRAVIYAIDENKYAGRYRKRESGKVKRIIKKMIAESEANERADAIKENQPSKAYERSPSQSAQEAPVQGN